MVDKVIKEKNLESFGTLKMRKQVVKKISIGLRKNLKTKKTLMKKRKDYSKVFYNHLLKIEKTLITSNDSSKKVQGLQVLEQVMTVMLTRQH